MATLVSNLVDNLAEGVHKIKCKDCDCFLEHESFKGNSIKCKCLSCNKDYSKKFIKNFKSDFRIHLRFLIMILINLTCC